MSKDPTISTKDLTESLTSFLASLPKLAKRRVKRSGSRTRTPRQLWADMKKSYKAGVHNSNKYYPCKECGFAYMLESQAIFCPVCSQWIHSYPTVGQTIQICFVNHVRKCKAKRKKS